MNSPQPTRRDFVKDSTATAAGVAAASLAVAPRAYAGEDNTLRVGLVGCGGRGTGAAVQALKADPNNKLVALGEAFEDRLEKSLKRLQKHDDVGDRVEVPQERRFVGFDAYRHVIDQVDVVLLATPPHFRPLHMEYAAEKGVHVFCEKPVATDVPMLRRCQEASKKIRDNGKSLVSGLCWRYHKPKAETISRVMDGAIGDLVALETVYNSNGVWDPRKNRDECDSEVEYQMRNWYYYAWLSGDHIVEQAIHSLDKMGWVLGEKPPKVCWGVGGRQVRTGEEYGNIYDHFSVVYEYDNGVRGYHQCRHWKGTPGRVRDYFFGSKGTADVFSHSISGENRWRFRGDSKNMYQVEHDELFRSIRENEPIYNGDYMCHSTMLAIMGRMAAYTGEKVTWDDAWNSEQELRPEAYEWGDAPQRDVPTPGVTELA